MGLVMVGLVIGVLVGLLLGWAGGRVQGLAEGAYRERRRTRARPDPSSRGLASAALQRDSMADLTDGVAPAVWVRAEREEVRS